MARDLNNEVVGVVTSNLVRPVLLSEFFFDTETLRFWNGVGEFVYNGDVFMGAGNLLSVGNIDETQKIEARGITATLSGIPSSLLSVALAEDYQGRPVKMKIAFLNDEGSMIGEPHNFFNGKADIMTITDGAETATINLTGESDIIALNRVNERRRTPEDQKIIYNDDSFFDNVAALQSKEILWGGNN